MTVVFGLGVVLAVSLPPSPPHLEPCRPAILADSVSAELHDRVRQTLGLNIYTARVVVLVEPSFGAERAVSLVIPAEGDASLVLAEASESIRQANQVDVPVPGEAGAFTDAVREKPAPIAVSRARRSLARSTAELLSSVVGQHARGARYPVVSRPLLDGTRLTFVAFVREEGTFCGTAQSPSLGSVPGQLKELAESLFRFVRDAAVTERSLLSKIQALRRRTAA